MVNWNYTLFSFYFFGVVKMKKEDKPKNRIFSKRVLVAFGIIFFIVVVGVFFSVILSKGEQVEKELEKPPENNESEETLEEGESDEEVDIFDNLFDNFPFFFAGVVAVVWAVNKFFRKIL